MSEWNVIHENFHIKHSVLTAPDEHMPYIIQLHIMSIRWTYYEQMKQQNIWLIHMTSIGKENKNKKYKGRGLVGRQSEGLGGVVWVYKWQSLENLCLSLSERDRELELEL